MTKSGKFNDDVMDDESLELLGRALTGITPPSRRKRELRKKVLHQIDDELANTSPYITIRANEGTWVELEPLVEKKVLKYDAVSGDESYLLRLHPGASPPAHEHEGEELCIVLEGEVSFDDIHLVAGDYHLARKGSRHGRARSVPGALIFLQTRHYASHA